MKYAILKCQFDIKFMQKIQVSSYVYEWVAFHTLHIFHGQFHIVLASIKCTENNSKCMNFIKFQLVVIV